MAFPTWPFLCLLLIHSTWAGPRFTESLTPYLTQVIPICAQSCLKSWVADNYPPSICGPPPNFSCLCTSDSSSGFTVGEGALECLVSACDDFEESEAISAYAVCNGIQDALPNTHGTLTAVQTTVVSSKVGPHSAARTSGSNQKAAFARKPSSQHSVSASNKASKTRSSTVRATSSIPSLKQSQSAAPPAGGAKPNTVPTTPTSTTTKASAAAASSPAGAPVLTKPQIAGVVVASVGAAAIAFGVLALAFCLRRRRRSDRRHSGSSSLIGDKMIDSEGTTPDMALVASRDFASHRQPREEPPPVIRVPKKPLRLETPATSSEDGWGQYQRSMDTDFIAPQVPPKLSDASPVTPASNRTHSQLLPDKPTYSNRYSLFPPPARTPRHSIPPSTLRAPGNTGSSSASRSPGSMNTSQSGLQQEPILRKTGSDPFLDNSGSSRPDIYPAVAASRPRSPRQHQECHPAFKVPSWSQPTGVVRKPVPAHQSQSGRGLWPLPNGSHQLNIPRNRALPQTVDQHYMAAIENSHRRQRSNRSNRSNARRHSNGSETSFEDDDDLDYEPVPVRKPQPLRSPFEGGHVRYPGVPTSASESPNSRHYISELPATMGSPPESRKLGKERAREIVDALPEHTQNSIQRPPKSPKSPSAKMQILSNPGFQGIDSLPSSTKYVERTPVIDQRW
ncbi:hypothetical protein MMC21_000147 [Puttea exsequens]|nr:hypothetical protein [Puttea exsequens]